MRFSLFSVLLLLTFWACNASSNTVVEGGDKPMASEVAMSAPAPKENPTIDELDKKYADYAKAYFAGGCFWCTEAAFDRINGVVDVYSGYTGGTEKDPTYREVASGRTSHAEAIVVYFDSEVVTYETLLDVFFVAHDPTQLNRQGPDVGPQYRSGIYFLSEAQETAARAKIAELENADTFSRPIVTELAAASDFYVAEGYHQDYYEDPTNPNQGYVQNITKPKVEKVMKRFADILKPKFKKKS